MTHSFVTSLRLIRISHMTYSRGPWLIHAWHTSCIHPHLAPHNAARALQMSDSITRDMTYLWMTWLIYEWHDLYIQDMCLTYICTWHDLFWMTWLVYEWHILCMNDVIMNGMTYVWITGLVYIRHMPYMWVTRLLVLHIWVTRLHGTWFILEWRDLFMNDTTYWWRTWQVSENPTLRLRSQYELWSRCDIAVF